MASRIRGNFTVWVDGKEYQCDEFHISETIENTIFTEDVIFTEYLTKYQTQKDPLLEAIELQKLRERARQIVARFTES